MGEAKQPSFVDRLAAAFTAAGSFFAIVYFVLTMPSALRSIDNPSGGPEYVIKTVLPTYAWGELIILAAIFGVAYPVELIVAKRGYGLAKTVALYAAAFGLIFALNLAVAAILEIGNKNLGWHSPVTEYPNSQVFVIVGAVAFVGFIVTLITRPIYPYLLRAPRTNILISSGLVVLMLLGFFWPRYQFAEFTNTAPVGTGFYPGRQSGELARGTWTLNHNTGVTGTDFYVSGHPTDPATPYELAFSCLPLAKPHRYVAIVSNAANGRQFAKLTFTCTRANAVLTAPVKIRSSFVPKLMLFPFGNRGNLRDAWAILQPAG